MLGGGDDGIDDELLPCVWLENVSQVGKDYLAIGGIEKLAIDGFVAYGYGDEHTAHGGKDVEVTYVVEEARADGADLMVILVFFDAKIR